MRKKALAPSIHIAFKTTKTMGQQKEMERNTNWGGRNKAVFVYVHRQPDPKTVFIHR
jgi:hypothetical protein